MAGKPRDVAFAQALIRIPQLSGRARQTGAVLAFWMGPDGLCHVGQRRLADEWAIGRKRLTADLEELRTAGVLEVLERAAERGTNRYRSLACFVGESADITLEDGTLLPPARSSGDALNCAARSSGDALDHAARSSGDALTSDQPPARSFEPPARSSEPPARSSGDANHQTTPPPIGGGVVAATATVATAPVSAPWGIDEALVLAAKKLPGLDTNNERLRTIVAERLAGGWTPERLIAAAFKRRLPKEIHSTDGFLLQRLGAVPCTPPVESAVLTKRVTPDGDELWFAWRLLVLTCIEVPSWPREPEELKSPALQQFMTEFNASGSVVLPDGEFTDRKACLEDVRFMMDFLDGALGDLIIRQRWIQRAVPTLDRALYVAGWLELSELSEPLLEADTHDSETGCDPAVLSYLRSLVAQMDVPSEAELDEAEPNDTQLTRCIRCGRRWRCEHRSVLNSRPLSSNHN